VTQVYYVADAVGLRYRALVLLAAFTSLRWAELAALRPQASAWTPAR
jgi:integrase